MNCNPIFCGKTLFASLFCMLLGASQASAGIFIDRSVLNFKPGESSRQDVKVSNDGDEPAYVQVEVLEVINPGTEAEERRPVINPEDLTFLVTPGKMVLPPGGSKLVRLVDLAPQSEQERVFRVNITPILAPLAEEGKGSQVRVVVAYQVLALLAPLVPEPNLVTTREGNTAHFHNQGNTYVLLVDGKQCPSDTVIETECVELAAQRLYPGNEWQLELPFDRPFEYSLETVQGVKKELFK